MNARQTLPPLAAHPPHREGAPPLGAATAAATTALLAALGAGCANTDANQVVDPVAVGMTAELAPTYDDGEVSIRQVQVPVRLPMRRPNEEERRALGRAAAPLPRAPFLLASDVRISVRFTLTNLDDEPRSVELLVDPWNEFVRYRPGIQTNGEEAMPDLSGYDKFFVVPAKSRLVGTLTPDDCTELAIDLATAHALIEATPEGVTNVAGLVNHAFNLQNRSNEPSPLIAPHIPKVIPGLIGFDLGLRTFAPANLAVEVVVDVEDLNGERLTPPDDRSEMMRVPSNVLSPPAVAE